MIFSPMLSSDSFSQPNRYELAWCRLIKLWLGIILVLSLAIVMLGGATRMTGSGLSITEWKPIHGIIPPISVQEWQEEFEKYQQIAQYQQVNKGMSLEEFKFIYWWEWSHRLLARIIGLIAALPFLYLFFRYFFCFLRKPKTFFKKLPQIIIHPLSKISFLIPTFVGIQGAIGWWMVASGLEGSPLIRVSQYRLSVHLIMACILILIVTYLARGFAMERNQPARFCVQWVSGFIVFLLMIQIYLGALVAGSHAGYVYNSWPFMNGEIVPQGLLLLKPVWRNFFENSLTMQFVHRVGAYIIFVLAFFHMLQTRYREGNSAHYRRSVVLMVLVLIQASVGIIALLKVVPIHWGLAHQFLALIVLIFATAHWRSTKALTTKMLAPVSCS